MCTPITESATTPNTPKSNMQNSKFLRFDWSISAITGDRSKQTNQVEISISTRSTNMSRTHLER